MELCTHNVVVVTGEDGDARSALPIPDANGLIVGGTEYPRVFMVEEDGADVVEMAVEGKETLTSFVVPDFDLVIVTTTD